MSDRAERPAEAEPPGIADQRRAQMLRAALKVISDRGYSDTRIADVAEQVGLSTGLVIYYFKTKDQLLSEAIKYYEDQWYAAGQRRMEGLPTAARRLEELVAMNLLDAADIEPHESMYLWLDLWVQAARNPAVARVRQSSDERWRQMIVSLVRAGQEAGEFAELDAEPFAIFLSALLDGLTLQVALRDPVVDADTAYAMTMRFVADSLGFQWAPGEHRNGRAGGRAIQATTGR